MSNESQEERASELLKRLKTAVKERDIDLIKKHCQEAQSITFIEDSRCTSSRKRTFDGDYKENSSINQLKQYEKTIREESSNLEGMHKLKTASQQVMDINKNDFTFLTNMKVPQRAAQKALIAFLKLLSSLSDRYQPAAQAHHDYPYIHGPRGVFTILKLRDEVTKVEKFRTDAVSIRAKDIPIENALRAEELLSDVTLEKLMRSDEVSMTMFNWCHCMIAEVKRCEQNRRNAELFDCPEEQKRPRTVQLP